MRPMTALKALQSSDVQISVVSLWESSEEKAKATLKKKKKKELTRDLSYGLPERL